jgi:mitogen-activated protein kinase 7
LTPLFLPFASALNHSINLVFFSSVVFFFSSLLSHTSFSFSLSILGRPHLVMADLQGRKVFKVFNQDFIVNEQYTVTKELGQGAYGVVW